MDWRGGCQCGRQGRGLLLLGLSPVGEMLGWWRAAAAAACAAAAAASAAAAAAAALEF